MTVYPFQPSVTQAYQFQPTLDGVQYTATVVWNLYSQVWYLNLQQSDGTVVFTKPLTGSPTGAPIASASFDEETLQATVTTVSPHGYAVGSTKDLVVSGVAPDGYNGAFLCFVVDPQTVIYALSANPGQATAFGSLSYDVDLAFGYFETSTLVYRASTAQFEVNP